MGCFLVQVDGDYHYDSRRQALLWNIELIDDSNRSGSLEFVIPSAVSTDAFFPVDITFSAQHTLVDAHIATVSQPPFLLFHPVGPPLAAQACHDDVPDMLAIELCGG